MIRRGSYNEAVFRMSKLKRLKSNKYVVTLSIEMDPRITKKRLKAAITFAIFQMAEFGQSGHSVIGKDMAADLALIRKVRVRTVDLD